MLTVFPRGRKFYVLAQRRLYGHLGSNSGEQGKYWEMYGAMFADQSKLDEAA